MNSPYFNLSGKINRKSYVLFGAIVPIVFSTILFITLIAMYDMGLVLGDIAGEVAVYLIYALTGLVALAPAVKRLRDIGLNGWLAVSVFIPYLSIIAMVLLVFWPGRPEDSSTTTSTAKL
ncbi:DUF805 domain-containing protein [Microbulbifer guangxiensis]|uniref:DUF805 domain-containing protein n=1 Tax=Microbulbifer guangxiensis TaxID=2904249 RepID=UPI001F3FD3BE|nr:DUF805 domain-containing protein [Microbulbifer guangxiensis]